MSEIKCKCGDCGQMVELDDSDTFVTHKYGPLRCTGTGTAPELYHYLFAREALWSNATFGTEDERDPSGPLKHILLEIVTELLGYSINMRVRDVINAPPRRLEALLGEDEYADLELLLMDAVRRAGITSTYHLDNAYAKLVRNEKRRWPKVVNMPGQSPLPVEHLREVALCPNCVQQTEVDSKGNFVAHGQYAFPCPESGKPAPPFGWEKE